MKTNIFFCLILATFYQVECAPAFTIWPPLEFWWTIFDNFKDEAARVHFEDDYGEKYPAKVVVKKIHEFNLGVPEGTILELDKGTGRYRPPPVSESFTSDDLIYLLWNNKRTRPNYCMVSPGTVSYNPNSRDYLLHQWCTDDDRKNICCDGKTCDCLISFLGISTDCECVDPK